MIEILQYDASQEGSLMTLMRKERDWASFTDGAMLEVFKEALLHSIAKVCVVDGRVCGYIRAIDDPFGVYISELIVGPEVRNRGCGLKLLHSVKAAYPERDVYVFSDEDGYYEKQWLARVGSVFKL